MPSLLQKLHDFLAVRCIWAQREAIFRVLLESPQFVTLKVEIQSRKRDLLVCCTVNLITLFTSINQGLLPHW